jgi:hypothetical protein
MNIHSKREINSESRRDFIGGSDARIIMGQDEKALIHIWQEKPGEVGPEAPSTNLIVQLGFVTEDLAQSCLLTWLALHSLTQPDAGAASVLFDEHYAGFDESCLDLIPSVSSPAQRPIVCLKPLYRGHRHICRRGQLFLRPAQ